MDHNNPYQTPSVPVKTRLPETEICGVWRDKNFLVVHKNARLPPICVKSNTPADREIDRKFYWHSPWLYILLIQLLLYVIAALATRKRHDLKVPISAETANKRSKNKMIAWCVGGFGFLLLVGGMIVLTDSNLSDAASLVSVVVIMAGLAMCLAGALFGTIASAILTPRKMTDHATWFKGAHPDYLNALPVLPPK